MNELPDFIKSQLDEDQHQNFDKVANALTHDSDLRRDLTLIACMAGFLPSKQTDPSDNHLLPQEFESAMSAAELIGREVVQDALGREKLSENSDQDSSTPLQKEIKKSLEALNIEKDQIESISALFPSDITIRDYVNRMKSSHHVRGMAFSSFNALKAFVTGTEMAPGTRKKQLTMTTEYLTALIGANADAELLEDEGHRQTKDLLQRYVKTCRTERDGPPKARLNIIRNQVVSNVRHYLTNDNASKESLYAYSQRENFPTRSLSDQGLNAILKATPVNNSASNPKSDPPLPQSYNCFLCPSASKCTENQKKECSLEFYPEVVGESNVQRVLPRDTLAEVKNHFLTAHTDSRASHVLSGHGFFIPCQKCLTIVLAGKGNKEIMLNLFACCLPCLVSEPAI